MRNTLLMLSASVLLAACAVAHAKLPVVASKTDAEKAAKARDASAAKTKDAALLDGARDRAVTNYRKNRGADHSRPITRQHEPTRKEEATGMPLPGQANDHSTPARRPGSSADR
jgi:hypothetical protein